jgi:hypothetical protein
MLEDELMARDRWSREDLLAHQRARVQDLLPDYTVNSSSTGAVPPAVGMETVSALPREPASKLRLVRPA